jgi:defect in organelle trafficking protein DotC
LEIFYEAGDMNHFSRGSYLLHTLTVALLSVQASVAFSSDDTSEELLRLMELTSSAPASITSENSMRHLEMDFTALSVGSSSGLKWRYDQIMENLLEPNAQHLNRIFDFSRFMVDGKIYLPAVRIAKDDITFEDDKQTLIRVSYTISEEAILRSSAPNFRDYLYRDFPTPEDPHWKLLPENKEERARWKAKVSEGFSKGVEQANDVYRDRLAEMRSDYLDRQNFLNLVSKNMVSQPSILVKENGITFNGRTMNVGEIVYQMSGDAEYLNETNWGSAWEK